MLDKFIPACGEPAARFVFRSERFGAEFRNRQVLLRSDSSQLLLSYERASSKPEIRGDIELPGRMNFITAGTDESCRSIPSYAQVSYDNLYKGISAHFRLDSGTLKSEYSVIPGANPALIRIRYSGGSLQVRADGSLLLGMRQGIWREKAPSAWQIIKGTRRPVPAAWRLNSDGTAGFALGKFDRSQLLVIDPTLSYSTYLTNATITFSAAATGAAVDPSGNLYIAGWIEGSTLGNPAVGQAANRGNVDAFLVKINAAGKLVFATYFGGSGYDQALGLTLDSSNQPWITGLTSSTDLLTTSNAIQPGLAGYRNAFIAQFSQAGNLLFSTYFGGTGPDAGNAIAADAAGNVYITGDTQSPNLPLREAAQALYAGGQDAFVAKISASGALIYSTYLGGQNSDSGVAIAVDGGGNAYITGGTSSSTFPTVSALQNSLHGLQDAFVTELNAAGNALIFSTYLGGSGGGMLSPEQGTAIALDSQRNVYAAGVTNSKDFPVTPFAPQTILNGQSDGFITKIAPSGNSIVYSTLLGGTGLQTPAGIAVDPFGAAAVAGYTSSVDFPSILPLQTSTAGIYDAFVTIVNPRGNGLYFSSVLGGGGSDAASTITNDAAGNLYLAGETASADLPLVNPLALRLSSGIDAFAARIGTSDSSMFVNRMYCGVLGVNPDPAGLAFWAGSLDQGIMTRSQVALSFFQVSQFQSAAFDVIASYISVLGRDPDLLGFQYWTSVSQGGALASPTCLDGSPANIESCSQAGLLTVFMASQEFQARFGVPDNTGFVTVVYQNVLGRPPDPGGLGYWVQELNAGLTRAQLLQAFINSVEFSEIFGNHITAYEAYFVFLFRAPNATELQAWTASLTSSGNPAALVSALVLGPEFKAGF